MIVTGPVLSVILLTPLQRLAKVDAADRSCITRDSQILMRKVVNMGGKQHLLTTTSGPWRRNRRVTLIPMSGPFENPRIDTKGTAQRP